MDIQQVLLLSIIINLASSAAVLALAIFVYLKYRFLISKQTRLENKIKTDGRTQQDHTEQMLDALYQQELDILKESIKKSRENQDQLVDQSAKLLDEGVKETIVQMKSQIQNKFNEYFSQTKNEIDSYKQDQLKIINEDAKTLIREVIKKALPEVIPSEDHTQIVLEALDRAKKEGFDL